MATRNILYLTSDSDADNPLDIPTEQAGIEAALREARCHDALALRPVPNPRTTDLRRLGRDHRPAIVHLTAHGDAERGVMMLPAKGSPVWVAPEAIANHLVRFGEDGARLVVLNACASISIAQAVVNDADSKIRVAIGMKGEPKNRAAQVFAAKLYGELAAGEPVSRAYQAAFDVMRSEDEAGFMAGNGVPLLVCGPGGKPEKLSFVRCKRPLWPLVAVAAGALVAAAGVICVKACRKQDMVACLTTELSERANLTEAAARALAEEYAGRDGIIEITESSHAGNLVGAIHRPERWRAMVDCGGKFDKSPQLFVSLNLVLTDQDEKPVRGAGVRLEGASVVHPLTCTTQGSCSGRVRVSRPAELHNFMIECTRCTTKRAVVTGPGDLVSGLKHTLHVTPEPPPPPDGGPTATVNKIAVTAPPIPTCGEVTLSKVRAAGAGLIPKNHRLSVTVEVEGSLTKSASCNSNDPACALLVQGLKKSTMPLGEARCRGTTVVTGQGGG